MALIAGDQSGKFGIATRAIALGRPASSANLYQLALDQDDNERLLREQWVTVQ